MLNFKPSEFLHIMRKMERGIREAVDELRAIRELLEEAAKPRYVTTMPNPDMPEWVYGENEDSSDASWKWRTKVDEA